MADTGVVHQPPQCFFIKNMLSKEAIVEYQKIYKDLYGKDISFEKAMEGGKKLLRLFRIIYCPISNTWNITKKKYGKNRKTSK